MRWIWQWLGLYPIRRIPLDWAAGSGKWVPSRSSRTPASPNRWENQFQFNSISSPNQNKFEFSRCSRIKGEASAGRFDARRWDSSAIRPPKCSKRSTSRNGPVPGTCKARRCETGTSWRLGAVEFNTLNINILNLKFSFYLDSIDGVQEFLFAEIRHAVKVEVAEGGADGRR